MQETLAREQCICPDAVPNTSCASIVNRLLPLRLMHIPSKQLFPQPRPSNLITVPSCEECNKSWKKDEDYFRSAILFGNSGISDKGRQIWDQKLERMYANGEDLGLRRSIKRSFREVEEVSPSGLFIRNRFALEVERCRIYRVIEKTVRGLHFFEYGQMLPVSTKLEINHFYQMFSQDVPKLDRVLINMHAGTRTWPDMFEYWHVNDSVQPTRTSWVLLFYGTVLFFFIHRLEQNFIPPEIRAHEIHPRRSLTQRSRYERQSQDFTSAKASSYVSPSPTTTPFGPSG